MCPKKLEIDNRNKKTPLVHRFMTAKEPPASQDAEVEKNAEIIPSELPETAEPPQPAEDNPSAAQNDVGVLTITEVATPSPSDNSPPPSDIEPAHSENINDNAVNAPEFPSGQNEESLKVIDTNDNIINNNGDNDETSGTLEEPAEVDYKSFITTVQDRIDGIKTAHLQSQEDMKAQLKAELAEEIKNEIKAELQSLAAKEIAAESKSVSEPAKEPAPPIAEKVEDSRYTFRNTMEDIVAEEVAGILKNEKNMCKCDRCVNDICAIALNSIPPHYVTSEVGQLYDRAGLLDITKLSELTKNIFNAIDQVKNKPSHTGIINN